MIFLLKKNIAASREVCNHKACTGKEDQLPAGSRSGITVIGNCVRGKRESTIAGFDSSFPLYERIFVDGMHSYGISGDTIRISPLENKRRKSGK
jgi:3D (Asp-Asp-Asp) domain-containing protein